MSVLKILVLICFLIIGVFSVLKPLDAARMTVKGLQGFMKLAGVQGDIIPTPRAVSFLRWWNVLMLGVTIVTLWRVAAPGD